MVVEWGRSGKRGMIKLEELGKGLGLWDDEYKGWDNFKRGVVDLGMKEMNENREVRGR